MFFSGVVCDKCGIKLTWNTCCAKKHLINMARDRGWTVGKKELCPNCRREKRGKV